jgi:hypothetical protein
MHLFGSSSRRRTRSTYCEVGMGWIAHAIASAADVYRTAYPPGPGPAVQRRHSAPSLAPSGSDPGAPPRRPRANRHNPLDTVLAADESPPKQDPHTRHDPARTDQVDAPGHGLHLERQHGIHFDLRSRDFRHLLSRARRGNIARDLRVAVGGDRAERVRRVTGAGRADDQQIVEVSRRVRHPRVSNQRSAAGVAGEGAQQDPLDAVRGSRWWSGAVS